MPETVSRLNWPTESALTRNLRIGAGKSDRVKVGCL